ncbi:tyrosine-type recombinase/integrase [Aeromonas allosaccharophila]
MMKYLQLRRHRYYLHWNVPVELRELPFFDGRAIYTKTLETSDLQQARRMRDSIVAEFNELLDRARAAPRRHRFKNLLDQIRSAVEESSRYNCPHNTDEHLFHAYDVSTAIASGDVVKADAIRVVLHGDSAVAKDYAMTLIEAVDGFDKSNGHRVNKSVISKARQGAKSLLKILRLKNVPLGQIEPRDVTLWLQEISTEKSDWTRKGYRSALSSVWEWCYLQKEVEGTNPFTASRFKSGIAPQKYKPFTFEQVQAMVVAASPQLKPLIKFGLVTGCRIGELVSLTPEDFEVKGATTLIRIKDGKTANAVRGIPLPQHLWEELKGHIEAGLWLNRNGKTSPSGWSAKFSTFKGKITGEREKKQCFHSFRGMTVTAYQNAGVQEDMTAQIVGHSKQGLTMSYGLYSSGYNYAHQIEAVEKMLAEDAMSLFLKLFNK